MDDLKAYLAKPQGTFVRWCDVIAVFGAGLSSLYYFYLIEFDICRNYSCEDLDVTSFYASASWWYLLFGFALLGVGFFLHRARELPRSVAMAITVSSLSGFVLSGMAVFAMLKEVRAAV